MNKMKPDIRLTDRPLRTEDLKDLLKRSGLKLTPQRLEILRMVNGTHSHPDAETIHRAVRKKIPGVSLDTVYRNLWTLIDHGLINALNTYRGRVHFDGNLVRHHHFVCTRCGLTRDFVCPNFDRLSVPDEVKAWGRIDRTRVEFRGLCERCAEKEKTRPY